MRVIAGISLIHYTVVLGVMVYSIGSISNSVNAYNSGKNDIWTTNNFGNADEKTNRKQLPKHFLPTPSSGRLLSLKDGQQVRLQLAPSNIIFQRTSIAYFHMPLVESTETDFYHDALQQNGWKIERETHTVKDTQIEASSGNLRGSVHVVHQDAGSDLDLTVICPE